MASALLSGAWSSVPWKKRPLEVANTHSRLHAKYTLPHFMAIYRHASSHVLTFFFFLVFFSAYDIYLEGYRKRGRKREGEDEEKKGGGLDESLESHKRGPRETCLSPIQPPMAVVFFLDPSTEKKKKVFAHVRTCTCKSIFRSIYFLLH